MDSKNLTISAKALVKAFMTIAATAGLFVSAAWAGDTLICEREGSNRHFEVNRDAFTNGGKAWTIVDRVEYPSTKTFFYYVKSESNTNGTHIVELFNENIYFQHEKTLFLRTAAGHTTLEYFTSLPCNYNCGGHTGEPIKVVFQCR